jgi:predicted dehydrogenase
VASQVSRVGIVGCGFFAQNHLAAWAAMEEVSLAAVCDLDQEKASAAKAKYAAGAAYTDAAQMLANERLDFVDIATTMSSHAFLVGLAAKRGMPVIVQKPLAPSWAECIALVEVCEAAGIPLMVHENTRFLKPVRKAREVIDSGRLGALTWARVSFRTGHDIYAKQPYLALEENFALLDLGVHMLDVARFLLGEVSQLYCQSQSIKPGIRGEDCATIMLNHESGATSVVECSYASKIHPDPFPQLTLHIEGTRGSLRVEPGYRMTVVSDGVNETVDVSPTTLPWSTPPWHGTQESVLRTQQHWVASLKAGREAETSGRDSLKTYGLVFGAYESARTRSALAPLAYPPLSSVGER